MSGFYRFGKPGEDTWAHLNTGRTKMQRCAMARFPEDNPRVSAFCSRISVALCDHLGCDRPICEDHRTRAMGKKNVDFCSIHKEDAGIV